MNEIQENILDNYKHPKHFGDPLDKTYISEEGSNISCGDAIKVFIKIDKDIIKDIRFTGEGCSISIASASLLYQDLIGKDIKDVLKLDNDYPERLMRIELTLSRKKCASLSLEAIKKAILKTGIDNK